MIQKCPNCGQWCQVEKQGFFGRASRGFLSAAESSGEIGAAIGSLFGKKSEKTGAILGGAVAGGTGLAYLNAAGEALFGDNYHFICPECGHEWSTDDPEDDQTEDYNEWVKEQERNEEIIELRNKFSTMFHASKQDIQDYVKELQRQLAHANNTEGQKAELYDATAATYHLLGNKSEALKAANASLALFDDDNTRILKGIIMGKGRNAQDTYAAMQEIILYKKEERHESPYYTTAQIEEEFSTLQTAYTQNFLSLPPLQRKHLFVCDELMQLPQNIKVLPLAEIPTEMKFPFGHPIANTLYVCHPYRTDLYIPYDNYSMEIFRDEIDEFVRIMEFMGAKHIEYSDTVDNESQTSQSKLRNVHGGADYGGTYSAQGSYEAERNKDEYEHFLDELRKSKDFALVGEPALPPDLVWYPHRIDWQRQCESRLAGRLLHHDFVLTTSSSVSSSESERQKIEADMKVLLFSANGGTEGQKSFSLKREQSHSLNVSVDFYPLSDYKKNDAPTIPAIENSTHPATEASAKKFPVTWIFGAVIVVLVAIIGFLLFL